MPTNYFELVDDAWSTDTDYVQNRWYLNGLCDGTGTALDSHEFCCGVIKEYFPLRISLWNNKKTVDVVPPLRVSLQREGMPLDFTYAYGDMPVVTSRTANLLAKIAAADIQRFPVIVEGQKDSYEIINIISVLDCIDLPNSDIEWFSEEDGIPEQVGKVCSFNKLVIDPDRVGNHHMFRLQQSKLEIFISDKLKNVFEEEKVKGVQFRKVS
jgi:hypothetical protein